MSSGSHPLPVRPARADFATCAAGDIVPGRKAWDFVLPGTGRISFAARLSHAARRVFIRLLPILTRRKACFHPSCANARLRFHSRPRARFHSFACPPLTRRKACFHSSCANACLCFHSRPLARFHSFLPHAAQPLALSRTRTSGWQPIAQSAAALAAKLWERAIIQFRTPSTVGGWQRRGLLVSQ